MTAERLREIENLLEDGKIDLGELSEILDELIREVRFYQQSINEINEDVSQHFSRR